MGVMVEEHLAEVTSMSKIELEEHLASQRDMPPKIVPSSQASVDCVAELLRNHRRKDDGICQYRTSTRRRTT